MDETKRLDFYYTNIDEFKVRMQNAISLKFSFVPEYSFQILAGLTQPFMWTKTAV